MKKIGNPALIVLIIMVFMIIAIASSDNSTTNETTTPDTNTKASEPEQETEQDSEPEPEPEYSSEEFKANTITIPYNDLVREPGKFEGEHIQITVRIAQVMVGGILTEAGFRAYDGANEWYIQYDLPSDAPRILENDTVTFFGEFTGLTNMKRALTGTRESVPRLKARYHIEASKEPITFDIPFVFDGLEIILSSEYTFTTVNSRYSDDHGRDLIRIPITIVNVGEETNGLNMFSYSFFGPDGLEIDTIWALPDDDISNSGDMRPEAILDSFMHIPYVGDGIYFIEFGFFRVDVEVKLEIIKND